MKLTIEQSLAHSEVEINIKCALIDPKLERLIAQIRLYSFAIYGKKGDTTQQVPLESILYFESIDERLFAYCQQDVFELESKLYEVEQQLGQSDFVRISKSCIVNIGHLHSVRALLNTKMELTLTNKEKLIVNRHFVPGFKEKFGV